MRKGEAIITFPDNGVKYTFIETLGMLFSNNIMVYLSSDGLDRKAYYLFEAISERVYKNVTRMKFNVSKGRKLRI